MPLDLSSAEDVQLLSAKEYELCSTLRLQPRAYLTMKEAMINENNQRVRHHRACGTRLIRWASG